MAHNPPSSRLLIRYDDLHRELQDSRSLFVAGYYQEAVRKSAERFHNRVRELSGYRGNKTGAGMLRDVFQGPASLLQFTDTYKFGTPQLDRDALSGFVDLTVGASAAIRNVFTHADKLEISHDRAFELLTVISSLHRMLDQTEPTEHAGNV